MMIMVIHGWRIIDVDVVVGGGDASGVIAIVLVLVGITRNIRCVRIFINPYVFASIIELD